MDNIKLIKCYYILKFKSVKTIYVQLSVQRRVKTNRKIYICHMLAIQFLIF